MKRKLLCMLFTLLPLTLTACGSSSNAETNFSDDDYGTVTLCSYKNLSATKNIYQVTDDDIETEIDMLLSDYAEYNEIDGPSKDGDSITVDLTALKDGETLFSYTGDDSYEIYLGAEEFGSEFDEKLSGVSVGDELSFSIFYDADYSYEDFANSTIDYQITILSITEEVIPELTETFITDTLGYDSQSAMEAEIKAELESENESTSSYELRENLIQQVIDGSTFESYSQDLYDSYATGIEQNYESYAEMFGCESVEEIYDLFGISEEDIEKEVITQVYRTIAVQAICKAENLTLTEEEYQEGLARYVEEIGYDNSDDLITDYGEDSLRAWIQEDKVLDFLEQNASVSEVETTLGTEEEL